MTTDYTGLLGNKAEYKGSKKDYWPAAGYIGVGKPPAKTGHVYILDGRTYIYVEEEKKWYIFEPTTPEKLIKGKCQKGVEGFQQVGSEMVPTGQYEEDCQPDIKVQGQPAYWKDAMNDKNLLAALAAAASATAPENICDIILVETIKSYLL